MNRLLATALALTLSLGVAAPAFAQSATLDRINQSGTLTIGTRTGSPPFAFVNKDNQWVGFTIDLVEHCNQPAGIHQRIPYRIGCAVWAGNPFPVVRRRRYRH